MSVTKLHPSDSTAASNLEKVSYSNAERTKGHYKKLRVNMMSLLSIKEQVLKIFFIAPRLK